MIWLGAGYRFDASKPNELDKVLGFEAAIGVVSTQILINTSKKDR